MCKHMKNVRSSPPCISINFCTELGKHKCDNSWFMTTSIYMEYLDENFSEIFNV